MLRSKILDRCLSKDPTKVSLIVEQERQRKERSKNMANRLRTSTWRARTRHLSQVPKNVSELDSVLGSDEWRHLSLTNDGSGLMYQGRCGSSFKKKTKCLIFMSASMKKCLKRAKTVTCESTWDGKTSLPNCSQMFSMVTKWDQQHYSSRVSGHARKLKLANLIIGSIIFRPITRSCQAIPLLPQEMLQHGLDVHYSIDSLYMLE
ncbi:hypothetical protein ONE63_000005 [Megalurothrips usitatus]|uniref:Uncharacterized protein n=1 Tax=Megalurothrips usitatus TaxID=439358 RepID=A0AAV7XXT8_9NEOP|nr:hypothetical protein ONE63_000005 [Megalurothrips usitatus]